MVRLLRLVRIARIARLLHHVPELLILVRAMVVATRAVFFSVILPRGGRSLRRSRTVVFYIETM